MTILTLLILAVCRICVIYELCGSVVEHQSVESKGLRFSSSWDSEVFFSCPTLETRLKNIFCNAMNSIFSYSFKPCEGFLACDERSRVSIGTRTSSEVSHWIGYWKCWWWCSIYWNGKHNPLYPNIREYILHTVLYNLPEVLTRRICWKIRSCSSRWSFPLFSWP